MPIPVQITFRDVPPSEALESRIQKRVERLERVADRATSLHVIVAAPHARPQGASHRGRLYQFTLEIRLPGTDIVVHQDDNENHAHEDPYVAMRDAFEALERRVHDHFDKIGRH
jgi:ribosomal subunit interface protein